MAKKSAKQLTGQVIVNSIITPQVSGTIVKADENFLTMRIRRKGSSKHEIKVFRREDVMTIWAEEGTGFSDVSGQADVCLRSEMAKLDSYTGNLSISDDGWFVCKGEEERVYITNPEFSKFIADDTEEAPKKSKKSDDDDEDEKPKKKAKKPADDDDEEDEKPKKKKKPVEDDEEDEKPKKKKKPADDDDEEDEAPKKKKGKKPVEDDDDDEDEKPKKKKKPADDDDDEDEAPKKKGKKAAKEDDDNWDDD